MKKVNYSQMKRSFILLGVFLILSLFWGVSYPAYSQDSCDYGECADCESFIPVNNLSSGDKEFLRRSIFHTLSTTEDDRFTQQEWNILQIWGQDDWAMVEAKSGSAEPFEESWLLLGGKLEGEWRIFLPNTTEFVSQWNKIPEEHRIPNVEGYLDWMFQPRKKLALAAKSSGVYRIPYQDGGRVYITRDYVKHAGKIDMVGQTGKLLVAAADGWIRSVVEHHNIRCCSHSCDKYNNYIVIEHPNGEWSKYLHIKYNSARVSVGQYVTAGAVIAEEGNVGHTCGTTGMHLHFEVRRGRYGAYLDPNFCGVPGGTVKTGGTYTARSCDSSSSCGGQDVVLSSYPGSECWATRSLTLKPGFQAGPNTPFHGYIR